MPMSFLPVLQRAELFFKTDQQDDQLVWTQWLELSWLLADLYQASAEQISHANKSQPQSSDYSHDYSIFQILAREIECQHISMSYGFVLHNVQFAMHILSELTDKKTDESFNVAYQLMFDAALNSPQVDCMDGLYQCSRAYAEKLIQLILNFYQTAEVSNHVESRQHELLEQCVSACENYLMYQKRFQSHHKLLRIRLAKSESFRIQAQALQNKNALLVQQYMGQTQIPGFAYDMLMNYWVLKMSIVQRLGESSLHDWQFYWVFATRLVRYFKSLEASASKNLLNSEFDYLYSCFCEETGSEINLSNRQFVYQLREFHLESINSIQSMQRARPGVQVKKITKQLTATADAGRSKKLTKAQKTILAGERYWWCENGARLACEVLVSQLENALDQVVLLFDQGKDLLTLDLNDLHAHLDSGVLQTRYSAAQCHPQMQLDSNIAVANRI